MRPGEEKAGVSLFCTPADSYWRYSSDRNSSKRNTVEEVRRSIQPERVNPVYRSDLDSIYKDKRRRNGEQRARVRSRESDHTRSDRERSRKQLLQTPIFCLVTPTSVAPNAEDCARIRHDTRHSSMGTGRPQGMSEDTTGTYPALFFPSSSSFYTLPLHHVVGFKDIVPII